MVARNPPRQRSTRRSLTLTIAGEGPERELARATLAASLDVPATFAGWVDDRAKADLLSRAAGAGNSEPLARAVRPRGSRGRGLRRSRCGLRRRWHFDLAHNGVNGRLVSAAAGADGLGGRDRGEFCVTPSARARLSCGARGVANRFTADAHLERARARAAVGSSRMIWHHPDRRVSTRMRRCRGLYGTARQRADGVGRNGQGVGARR